MTTRVSASLTDPALSDFELNIAALQNEVTNLQGRADLSESAIEQANTDISLNKSNIEGNDTDILNLNTIAVDHGNKITTLENDVNSLDSRVSALEGDLVGFSLKVSQTHTFQTSETAVEFVGVPDFIQGVEIVDTVFGANTGLRLVDNTEGIRAEISGYMQESGSQTNALIRIKSADISNVNDSGSFVTEYSFAFRTSSTNAGSIEFSPNKAVVFQDTVMVLTSQLEDDATVTFEQATIMGHIIPAVYIGISGRVAL